MAIASAGAASLGNNAGSFTGAYTVAGTYLFVSVVAVGSGGADTVTACSYNGVAMTLLGKLLGQNWVYLFGLLNPTTGSHNVVVTATFSLLTVVNAADYSGVDILGTATPVTHGSASSATNSATITTVEDNCWCVMAGEGYNGNAAQSAGSGTTQRIADGSFNANGIYDSNGVVTPAGSKTLNYQYGNSVTAMAAVIASIAPPAGGTTPVNETVSDTITLTDSASAVLVAVLEQTVSDDFSLTDSIATELDVVLNVVASDSLGLADSISYFLDYVLSESLTLSDSIAKLLAGVLSFNDTISLSDLLRIQVAGPKEFFDRLIMSDLLTINAPASNVDSDTIVLSDNARIVLALQLSFSDSITLSDSASVPLASAVNRTVSDSMSLSDSVVLFLSTSTTNYLRDYLNDVQGIRTPETITSLPDEDPDALNDYLRRYLNDVS